VTREDSDRPPSPDVQLAVIAAALRAMRILRGTPRLRLDARQNPSSPFSQSVSGTHTSKRLTLHVASVVAVQTSMLYTG
jgi:hypothetical protein